MVLYTEFPLDNNKNYTIRMSSSYKGSVAYFRKTRSNAFNMKNEGRPVTIINPSRSLSPEEKEQYRAFFCKHAKVMKRNCIYFEGPVIIEECNLKE